jgi:uncharacterized membrane protein YqjE
MSQAYEPPTSTTADSGNTPSIGTLVSAATRDISTLVRGEIELAKSELKADAKAAARGGVLLAIAAVFGLFLLFMLLIAFAEGLVAAGMWRWLAYLVVAIVLMILAAIAAFVALRSLKKIKPPERTIETTKDTIEWVKKPTQQPAGARSPSELPATRR